MPPVFAAIPGILAAVGGGSAVAGAASLAGLGLSAAEATKMLTAGGGPEKPTAVQTAQQQAQNRAILASTVQRGLGNQQEAGGGGLSPGYLASAIGNQSGTSNQLSLLLDLIKQYTSGGGGGGSSGFGGGTSDTSLPNLSIPTQTTNTLNSGPGLADSSIFA